MAHRTDDHSDLTLFKNRLWKLMDEKHVYTTKELAKKLYNQKLVTVRQKNSYDEPNKIYSNAVGAIDKKIQKHLNADTAKELQGEFVIAYCTFFGCSSDYLFGFINCATHDMQFIHDYTGLSEDTIDELNNPISPKWISEILDKLIPMMTFKSVLLNISKYATDLTLKKKLEHSYHKELKQIYSNKGGNYNGEGESERKYHELEKKIELHELRANKWFMKTMSLIEESIEKAPNTN